MRMKKKRILFHLPAGNSIGGIEVFFMNYLKYLDKNKIQIDTISYDRKPLCYQEIMYYGGCAHVISGRRKNYFLCCKQIKDIYIKNQYDVVWSNLVTLSDILVLKFAYKYKIKKRIVHSHNSDFDSSRVITNILHNLNKRKIAKYATDFWACSEIAGKFMYSNIIVLSPKFKIIHNSVDVQKFAFMEATRLLKRKELGLDNKLVIGHIGRFCYQKNHEFLLQIFAEIYKKRPDSVLLLIGDGDLKKYIIARTIELGIRENVYFLGMRTDIPELLHAMDIFLLPSHFEGLSVVLIEAQVAGLKCFVSDVQSKEVMITDAIYMISLKKSAVSWANIIIGELSYQRKDNLLSIQKAGYDISSEVILVERYICDDV